MIRRFIYSYNLKILLRLFFMIFYDKKYLCGRYFDEKRMGWYWAYRGLNGRIFGDNRKIPWPVHPRTIISNPNNIEFSTDDLHIFQTPGCYWQNHSAKIKVGSGCFVAPNVGFITVNHNVNNLETHEKGRDISIGDNCWIGMNAVILPGVVLGNHTIVGAGSVVTRSFPDGNCIIAGSPSRIIRQLDSIEKQCRPCNQHAMATCGVTQPFKCLHCHGVGREITTIVAVLGH